MSRLIVMTILGTAAVTGFVSSAALALANCWTWIEVDCCSLDLGYSIKCALPPPEDDVTWKCTGETVTVDPEVGTWVISEGGYANSNTGYTTTSCQFDPPLCGSLPGTCTLDEDTEEVICRSYNEPGPNHQFCPQNP